MTVTLFTAALLVPSGPAAADDLATLSAHERELDRPPSGWTALATATELLAPVYDTLSIPRYVVGSVQKGTVLAARPADSREPCHDNDQAGRWYEVPGGFVCTASGYAVGSAPAAVDQRRPDLSQAVPFSFVKVTTPSSIRYDEPTAIDDAIAEYQTKAYFLAVHEKVERGGKTWVRTVYDEWVQADEVRPVVPTKLEGERLGGAVKLPLAFVYGDEGGVAVECPKGSRYEACGTAAKHSRFPYREARREGWVERPDGALVPRESVRVIERIGRPAGVPPGAKWVHVNLAEQNFVAYEGDTPVYTSLISTGVVGHDTPNGLHRVYRKYVTKTMRGPDDEAGRYRVEEIPWVMYYHGNYALHGAYWHNEFGNVRSHGCTNIAPPDAKWLYEWGTGEMPAGWHANYKVQDGTWVYFTGSRAEA